MFLNAASHYDGLDYVIAILKKDYGLDATFSTPTRYLDDVESELAQVSSSSSSFSSRDHFIPTVKSDSLQQYVDRPFNDWTGFYSSRPFLKQQIRSFSTILRAAELLHSIAMVKGDRVLINRDSKSNNAEHLNHKNEGEKCVTTINQT